MAQNADDGALTLDAWVAYSRQFHLTLSDVKEMMENGQSVDVMILTHKGRNSSNASLGEAAMSPMGFFKRGYFARVRILDDSHLHLTFLNSECKVAEWTGGRDIRPRDKFYVEVADDVFAFLINGRIKDGDFYSRCNYSRRVKNSGSQLYGRHVTDFPGRSRIGFDGGAPFIRVRDLKEMRRIVRD